MPMDYMDLGSNPTIRKLLDNVGSRECCDSFVDRQTNPFGKMSRVKERGNAASIGPKLAAIC